MNKIFKIILIILFSFSIIILSFYTFLSGKNQVETDIHFSRDEIHKKEISKGIQFEKINFFSSIYSSNQDYTIGENKITVGTGLYLIDAKDIFNDLVVDMGTNSILIRGGATVYINNNPKRKKIISFNNKIKIQFYNKDKNKKGVEVYLYPHMYIGFLPYRFQQNENMDSLRVFQLSGENLKYFNSNFDDIINGKEKKLVKKENFEFLSLCLNNILSEQNKYFEEFNIFRTSTNVDKNSFDFIEKNFVLFYNDRKKAIYYKNKILNNIVNILLQSSNTKSNIIIEDLEKLKKVDEKEYNKMKIFIKKLLFFISYDMNEKDDNLKENYKDLLFKVFKIKNINILKFIEKVDFYNYKGNFNKYLELLILNIDEIKINSLENEYYILFKQNALISNFSNFNISQNNFNILLKGFVSYSKNIEENIIIERKDKFLVNIIYNIELLEKLFNGIENKYFEKDRDSQGLLLIKNDLNISNLEEIKLGIKKIFKKYQKGLKYLRTENNGEKYIKKYDTIIKKLNEYILAIDNYSLYKKQYSKVNKALLGVEVYKDDEDILSKKSFINYIKEFNGISLNDIEIDIEENFYNIKNININGSEFSFKIYPYQNYSLEDIKLKSNKNGLSTKEKGFYEHIETTSFSIEKQKEKYQELLSKSKKEDKEKYDFKNFFKNTLFPNKEMIKDTFEIGNIENKDDDVIQSFKRTKLLGNRGEFRGIIDLLNIKYINLDVIRKNQNDYVINIRNALLKVTIKDNNNTNYEADFSSSYKLDSYKHYFYKIKINPYIIKNNNEKDYLFKDMEFTILGKIQLKTFKEDMKKIFSDFENIKKSIGDNNEYTKILYNIVNGKYYLR